ncbi:hypothetical protein Y032_0106g3773 [Ancylostoma ceylanicum]|nr:hypothetical protein Y032_0106g3773 [Ancylostoma ceylanicum]
MFTLLLITLVASAYCAEYSDKFARMLLPLSSAAYVDNPWMCLAMHFPNSQVDWPYGGMVSKYFYDGFMRIWKAGMEADMKLLTEQYPDYEIWVTGHSLGGAMASLAAHAIVGSGIADSKKLKLITLGQPRTGDKVFAKNHTASIDYSFRVTHWRDVVPHIPSFDERPAGYYHHKSEVFYKKGMSPKDYIVCEEYEDFKCSNGLWVHTSVANHKNYFGKVIRDWGIAGCL